MVNWNFLIQDALGICVLDFEGVNLQVICE